MKRNIHKSQKKLTSRIGAFVTILGLSLTALFTSVASADPVDTDPMISVDGTCDLWGPDTPGFNMQIVNNDSWDESYGVAVFSGFYEDPEDLAEVAPDFVFEETVIANSLSGGQHLMDSIFATIQVVNIAENGGFGGFVFHEAFLICAQNLPDFLGDDDEDSDDGPNFNFDFMPELPDEPQLPDFDFGIPGFGDGENDDNDDSDDGPNFNFDFMPELPDEPQLPDFDFGIPGFGDGENDDNENHDDDETAIELESNNAEEDGEETLIQVEDNDVEANDSQDNGEAQVEVNNDTDEGDAAFETENINANQATEIVDSLDPKITHNDTDNKNQDGELASVEEKDSQDSSGGYPLWIIPIIVGGITIVGVTTLRLKKNS